MSNLSFLSKVIERCTLTQFLDHCKTYDLLPDFQSAYREHYSTETSLLRMTSDILMYMDRQKCTMTGILDLSAAFDTVHHETFIKIMHNLFEVSGTALKWFKEYLAPRGFKVCVGSQYSDIRHLEFSVPQGSCASAPLFTAYCSPIKFCISDSFILNGFADDHSLRKSFDPNNRSDEYLVFNELSDNLISIKRWMSEMRLKMNGEKSEYIVFGNRRQLNKCINSCLRIDGDVVERSKCVKYLGAYLDESLSMKTHVTTKCKAAWINLRKLQSLRKYITTDMANTLAITLCISHLDYANSLLFGVPEMTLKPMQRVQNACTRMVLRRRKFDSASEALGELHWLPIKKRILYKIACLVFNCIHNNTPRYLIELINYKSSNRTLRSNADNLLLAILKCKTKTFGPRSFAYSGPKHGTVFLLILDAVTLLTLLRKI